MRHNPCSSCIFCNSCHKRGRCNSYISKEEMSLQEDAEAKLAREKAEYAEAYYEYIGED